MSAAGREERFYRWANATAPEIRKGYALGLHKRAKDAERARSVCASCGSDGGTAGVGGTKHLCPACELGGVA